MGFNLNVEEYKFPLDIFQNDKKIRVVHLLRAPNDDEINEYMERMSEFDTENNVYKPTRNKAAVWLWNQIAVSVEGYDFNGDFEGMKKKIPLTHKVPCINEILSIAGIVSEKESEELAKK